METTRRGFLGRALAGLAALTAPAAAATQEVVALEPGNFGVSSIETEEHQESERLRNALLKAQLDEAIYSIDPKETPFIGFPRQVTKADLEEMYPMHEISEKRIVSAIDVKPNPDPLFRLLGREEE